MQQQFKISGQVRRKLKKELSLLKVFYRNFWHIHQLEKDMSSFYCGPKIYDKLAEKKYSKTSKKIAELEDSLSQKA